MSAPVASTASIGLVLTLLWLDILVVILWHRVVTLDRELRARIVDIIHLSARLAAARSELERRR